MKRYKTRYSESQACIEILHTITKCQSILDPRILFTELPQGQHTAQAFITDEGGLKRHLTSTVSFTVMTADVNASYVAESVEIKRRNLHLPKDLSLLEWAQSGQKEEGRFFNTGDPHIVVGVKSTVSTNFARRQAIRQTWGNRAKQLQINVLFLGCVPLVSDQRLQNAVEMEKKVYGDFLTQELEREDTYGGLVSKTKAFFHFVSATFPRAKYVMMVDDDVYLQVDKLVQLLNGLEGKQVYLGQRWISIYSRSSAPVRDENHRNHLPASQYPMSELLPYAFGPHYVVSMDCVRFISKNHWRLKSLNGLEDASVGLWLLVMQVHLKNTQEFSHLSFQPCRSELTSFAELSTLGIRAIHQNVVAGRDRCYGYDRVTWIGHNLNYPKYPLDSDENPVEVHFEPFVSFVDLEFVQVTTIFSTQVKAGVKAWYFPSVETFSSYARTAFRNVKNNLLSTASDHNFTLSLQEKLQNCYQLQTMTSTQTELWRHNIFDVDIQAQPLIVAYAPGASYSSVVLECLFTSVFEEFNRPVLVMPEKTLQQHYGNSPDIFVFSSLNGCNPVSSSACQEMIAGYFELYSSRTQLVMITGEAWSTEGLDERVLLISTVANVDREKHVYLSMASLSFEERLNHEPNALLSSASRQLKTKFCAYLYFRCEESSRELMFDLLNALRPVDALGKCAGSSRPANFSKIASRFAMFYNDDAVVQYAPYKFVIAFENSRVDGYVTEKLVNAFLAGSVPVYLGPATVSQVFNPHSFIDCGRFNSLQDCAQYVVEVNDSPELYEQMRKQPPVTNRTAFNEVFSWHPSVPSRFMADEALQHIQDKIL